MKKEHSAGVIVYKLQQIDNKQQPEFLLLKNSKGHWDFPKGIIESGETDLDAALRETKEETGLTDISLEPNFKHKYDYFYKDKDNNLIHKTVTLFLGKLKSNNKVNLSFEHIAYKWVTIQEAKEVVSFDNAKTMLDLAKSYLNSKI